jgi:hypothetical protein
LHIYNGAFSIKQTEYDIPSAISYLVLNSEGSFSLHDALELEINEKPVVGLYWWLKQLEDLIKKKNG